MNQRKQEIFRRRIIDLIRHSSRKVNCLRFHSNETYKHKFLKFKVFDFLQIAGYEIYTECIFLSGKRADILAIKDGRAIGIEILSSETRKECSEKLKSYPDEIDWFMVKEESDIINLN